MYRALAQCRRLARRFVGWGPGLAFLVLTCAIAWAISASATIWRPPLRPLTDAEHVEFGVSLSSTIAVGVVSAVRESIDAEGMAWRWMDFTPRRTLKGEPLAGTTRVYFPTISTMAYSEAFSWSEHLPVDCLLFLNHSKDGKWVLVEHPESYCGGMARLSAGDPSPEVVAVERGIVRQSVEGLARRAQLVVVGTVKPSGTPCRVRGLDIRCVEVSIESVFAGDPSLRSVRAYAIYTALEAREREVLVLRTGEGGAYELVGFEEGVKAIQGDRLAGSGMPLAEFATRVRKAGGANAGGK